MHFTAKIAKFQIDIDGYSRELAIRMRQLIKEGIAEWVRAVIEYVPVSTGMARASLKPIGDAVGVDIFSATTISNEPIKKASSSRNQPLGESLGTSFALASLGTNQYQNIFQFNINVYHYSENEVNYMQFEFEQVETPWHSLEHGEEAFKNFIEAKIARVFPRIKDYLLFTQVNI